MANRLFRVAGFLPALTLLFAATAAFARSGPQTLHVAPTGAEYTTVQGAVDAANPGDTIIVKPGVYEGFHINKPLTVTGEPGAIIRGPFRADNAIPDGVPVDVWLQPRTSYAAASSTGIRISVGDVEVSGFTIEAFNYGVNLAATTNVANISLSNLVITDVVTGITAASNVELSNLSFNGLHISHGASGILFENKSPGTASVHHLTIDGTTFSDLLYKGFYTETLSNSTLRNIVMNKAGYFGRTPKMGQVGAFGNAIDLNLKYGTYENILIENFELTNAGLSIGAGTPHEGGGAIVVKAREDGSYASNPASYVGELILRNGTISGTSTGLRIGEPGVAGLSGVNVRAENVKVEGHLTDGFAAFENLTDEALTLVGTDETDVLVGTAGSDRLVGGAGNDMLNGGEGEDVAVYSGNQSDYVVQYRVDLDAFLVQDIRPGAPDGLDILVGVELGEFADGTVALAEIREPVAFIVDDDGEGHFTSLQDAISAARDGDSIMVMPGLYVEETKHNGTQPVGLVIDKSVSIVGVTEALEAILSAEAVQATIRSGVESSWGTNFYVTAPDVAIVGLRFEAVARGNDASLPAGAVNKAFEVVAGGFTLNHSVVAAAPGYNYDGWTSTAIYFGDEDPDDLESFVVVGNVLEGGITITNGAGDSGAADFRITQNTLSGTHFLRVRGQIDEVGWLNKHAGLPTLVAGNDLTQVREYLLQSWDENAEWLADLAFVESLLLNNVTGPYAFLTNEVGAIGTIEYEEYGGTAPAVLVVRDSADLMPIPAGYTLHGPTDTDEDGIPDVFDTDIDGDGIANVDEGEGDLDNDGISNQFDTDSDGDGFADALEGTVDSDGDGTADFNDADSDNDGIMDADERAGDTDGDGTEDRLDASIDEDEDGIPDVLEGHFDPDLDGIPAFKDTDSDGDLVPDTLELGDVRSDADGDGVADRFDVDITGGRDANEDGIDDTPIADTDQDGQSDLADADQDGDGISDFAESGAFAFDSDGDGIDDNWDADTFGAKDVDGDGISDAARLADKDSDGVPNVRDLDSDRDGVLDAVESGLAPVLGSSKVSVMALKAGSTAGEPVDTDGDGVPDYLDLDSDNDSIMDVVESGGVDVDEDGLLDEGAPITVLPLDTDLDGTPDMLDLDSDNDGVTDIATTPYAALDTDGDGAIDTEVGGDVDEDGIPDIIDGEAGQHGSRPDHDLDGVPSEIDVDDDNDGVLDAVEGDVDSDGDGTIDRLDRDSDQDGLIDRLEAGLPEPLGLDANLDGLDDAYDAAAAERDTDGDGRGDRLDTDSDDDGLTDAYEVLLVELSGADTDGDGIDNALDVDATGGQDENADGVDDATVRFVDTDKDGLEDWRDADSDNDGTVDGREDGDFNGDGINDRFQEDPGIDTGVDGGASGGGSFGWLGIGLLAAAAARRRLRLPGRMLSLLLLAGTLGVFAPRAQAEEGACQTGAHFSEGCWSASLGYSWNELRPDDSKSAWKVVDDQDRGYKLSIRYRFFGHSFFEFGYADMGSAVVRNLNPAIGRRESVDYKVPSLLAGVLLLSPESPVNLSLKAGWASLQTHAAERVLKEQLHRHQFALGAGLHVRLGEHWLLELDYDKYDTDAERAGLSLRFVF